MVDEPLEEQELGRSGVQLVVEVGEDALVLHLAGKWRVREDDVEQAARVRTAEAGRNRVPVRDVRLLELVEVEVEDGDLHHVGVVVEAGERPFLEELPLCRGEARAVEDAALLIGGLGVFAQDVREGRDEEAGSAAGRITNLLTRLRVDELDDKIDNVARRAELAVRARGRELREEVLVHVTLDVVPLMGGEVEGVDALHDKAQRRPVVYLERRAAEQELPRLRHARELVQALYRITNRIEKLVAG